MGLVVGLRLWPAGFGGDRSSNNNKKKKTLTLTLSRERERGQVARPGGASAGAARGRAERGRVAVRWFAGRLFRVWRKGDRDERDG
jgi:hypothetical protein